MDRSSTLQKITHILAEAWPTREAIRDALADRDIYLGYRKFSGRPDERAEVEYRRSTNKAVREAEARRSMVIVPEVDGPGVFDARWLLNEEFPPIRWVGPDILSEDVTILAGKRWRAARACTSPSRTARGDCRDD